MSCYKALIIVIVAAILCGCSDSARVDAGADEPETGSSPLARLGQYDVTREGGRLRISRNGRTVWETTDAPVTLARTDLDVSEERALFDIDENSEQRCTGGTFDSLSGVADDIRLSGRFADGPCENVGYTLRLTAADGQVRFDLKSDEPAFNEVSLALAAPANEPFYGFGEQTELNLRGLDVPVIVQEQGIGRGGSVSDAIGLLQQLPVPDAQKALIATFANAQGNALTTYYAAPLTVTGDGAGLLLENTGYSRFDLRADDHIEVHAFAGRLVGRLYGGDNLLETVTQATAYTGRMPPLPAWTQQGAVIGIQGGTATVRQRYQTLKDAGVPITGLWLQDWAGARSTFGGAASMTCWNWELDDDRYPQWDQLRQDVAADGVRLLGYFNPYLVADVPDCNAGAARNLYQEAKAAGYLVKNASGEPYQLTITDFDAGIVDLTNPQAYDWLKHIIETQVEKNGFSGWMADFAEGLPFDAVLANGESGRAVHNRYPVLWTQLNDEVVRDLGAAGDKVFFRRSGFTRSPAYATLFWAGDQATVWDDRDGLQSAITSIINGGFSGMALNHSDVGGYTSLGLPVSPDLAGYIPAQFKLTDPATGQLYAAVHRTPELLLRWSEFAAFTAMMRTHEGLAPALNAQVYSSPQLAGAFARMVAVYRAFAPYRATLMDQAENKGWPLVRHPLMNAGDPWFVDMTPQNIEFMLGAHVLVAPVVTPDTDTRAVHLPQGEWTHLWSGHTYSVGAAGQTFTEAHAGLGAPPVYVDMDDPAVAGAVDVLKAAAVVRVARGLPIRQAAGGAHSHSFCPVSRLGLPTSISEWTESAMRRWNGWGDDTFDKPVPETARRFLEARLGRGARPVDAAFDSACAQVPASRLDDAPVLDVSPEARLRHAHGQSFADWAALRHGHVGPFPDAVATPATHAETRTVLDYARTRGAVVIPYGGGTSVVGHLQVVDDGRPVISVDMSRQARLLDLDARNRIARLGAGAPGPVLEAQLRAHGYVLGHYPQSFDYSTLGGWIVTRSAGQQSRRYGRIETLFHGARLACPEGDFDVGGQVASSAGPDLRQLVLGSEGRLGIVTAADVQVTPVAGHESFHAVFFGDWASALAAARAITQAGVGVSMLRVSNEDETDTQLRIAGHEAAIAWLRRYLGVRGLGDRHCLMMLGVTGTRRQTHRIRADALAIARSAGGVHAGRAMGRIWAANRFAGAYLRNGLWDAGYAVDTMETAVPWSATTATVSAMQQAAHNALARFGERALAFTHISHVYAAGSSVYMTVIWRRGDDYDTDMTRWHALKGTVSAAIVAQGGTISHQHGVGADHAPYLAAEKSETGLDLIRAALAEFDPQGMMNPHKLVGTPDVD